MYLLINIIGLAVFVALAFFLSRDRKAVDWKSIGMLLGLNIFVAWFLLQFSIGREMVTMAADAFVWVLNISFKGIAFAFPDWVNVPQMNFFTSVLMPLIMIIPLFDILTYLGILPFILHTVGKALAFITRQPKFESVFAIEMMFLGASSAIPVSRIQLAKMNSTRNLGIAMMSISCVSAACVGAYTQMMPAEFVLTAIPLNVINSLIVVNILNPVKVPPEEDTIEKMTTENREPFFSFLNASIVGAGHIVLLVCAMVIGFVALISLIDNVLGMISPMLTLANILGTIFFPFTFLLGLETNEAFTVAKFLGTKIVTNEFVVMLQAGPTIGENSRHMQAVLTALVTSFANFGTIGIITGVFRDVVDKETFALITNNVKYIMLAGILVSLLSAALVGIFVW
ncbi:MAG: NupC/NupG family nucleoside CNT transporter [Selenomonadaceae bacterium]|nr:NupC/NupG family nucleoside CNT transporter [Selenomonadaceae bacterium]